jgi:hypothetical protein
MSIIRESHGIIKKKWRRFRMKTIPMTFTEFRDKISKQHNRSWTEAFSLEEVEGIVGKEYVVLPSEKYPYRGNVGACFKNGIYLMGYDLYTRNDKREKGEMWIALTGSRTTYVGRDEAYRLEWEMEKQKESIQKMEKLLEVHRMRLLLGDGGGYQ